MTTSEEIIMVNRVIREDPSKGTMHNRQPITPKLLWQSLKDYDLWPLYIIGLTFETPMKTPSQYLTLSLKGLGFNTFQTNLLTIPNTVLHIVLMMALTYASETVGELTLISMLGQVWALPFLVYLYVVDINSVNKWVAWVVMTLLLAYPSGESLLLRIVQTMLIIFNFVQHTQSKSAGTRATPTPSARAPSPQPHTTCACKHQASSHRTSTEQVRSRQKKKKGPKIHIHPLT